MEWDDLRFLRRAIAIADLQPSDAAAIEQAAHALVAGFRDHAPDAWPDLAAAHAEVHEALEPGKLCRVARDWASLRVLPKMWLCDCRGRP